MPIQHIQINCNTAIIICNKYKAGTAQLAVSALCCTTLHLRIFVIEYLKGVPVAATAFCIAAVSVHRPAVYPQNRQSCRGKLGDSADCLFKNIMLK